MHAYLRDLESGRESWPNTGSKQIRWRFARYTSNPKVIVKALTDVLLRDPSPLFRERAANLIGRLRDPAAGAQLRTAINDPEPGVRAQVCLALGDIADRGATDMLQNVLYNDKEPLVRRCAAQALEHLADPAAAAALAGTLKNDAENDVRRDAADALGAIGGTVAIDALNAALLDRDRAVCAASEDALERLGALRLPLPGKVYEPTDRSAYEGLRSRGRVRRATTRDGVVYFEVDELLVVHFEEGVTGGFNKRHWYRTRATGDVIQESNVVPSTAHEGEKSQSGAPAEVGTAGERELLGPGLGEFILIAGGEFKMGRNDGENADERPEHVVELSPFYVAKTPTTNAQFVRFLNEADISPRDYFVSDVKFLTLGIKRADGKWFCTEGCENDAACCQSWVLAQRYCHWLSAKTGRACRLPTEAEWEYVCRGKQGRKFPWGDETTALNRKVWGWRGWKADKPNLIPVGQFPEGATPEGVCDLVGYMDEACSDWFDPDYYRKSPRKNPLGPAKAAEIERLRKAKVTRGGLERRYESKLFAVRFLRGSQFFGVLPSAYLPRGWSRGKATPPKEPRFVYGRLGFRVVVDLPAAK